MRIALAALLLALVAAALAGCTSGSGGPPGPDPNGSRSFPPTPDSNTTGPPTGPPTWTSNSTSASSSSSPTATQAPTSFGPHDQEDTASDAAYPGLGFSGHLTGSGPSVHVEVAANDFGGRTYRVPDGACAQPVVETMRGPSGQAVLPRQPPAPCHGFALRDFLPGDYVGKSFQWDGRLWNSTSEGYEPAPVGTYTWQVTFDVYPANATGPSGGVALQLEFTVHVR
jgi:hypothetical protein